MIPLYSPDDKSTYRGTIRAMADDICARKHRLIALFGPWGSGKSTLLSFVADEVEKKTGPLLTTIDAWENRLSSNLLLSVLSKLIEPDETKDWTQSIDEIASSSSKEVAMDVLYFFASALSRRAGFGGISDLKGDVIAAHGVPPTQLFKAHSEERVTFAKREQLFRAIEFVALKKREKGQERGVCVIVDNPDRCEPAEVLQVIECFQVARGFEKLQFVFALDEKAAGHAIRTRYPSFTLEDSQSFVEKIFFPIHFMPQLKVQDLAAVLEKNGGAEIVEQLAKSNLCKDANLQPIADVCEAAFGGNPRKSIHFLHQFRAFCQQHSATTPLPFDGDVRCTALICAFVVAFPKASIVFAQEPDRFAWLVRESNPQPAQGTRDFELRLTDYNRAAAQLGSSPNAYEEIARSHPALVRVMGAFVKDRESLDKDTSRAKAAAVFFRRILGLA